MSATDIPTLTPSVVWHFSAELGEGPVWDDLTESLYWLDIKGSTLQIMDTKCGRKRSAKLPIQVSALALRERGGLVVATRNGFGFLDLESFQVSFLSDPEEHLVTNRFNDGKCDRSGNFVAGTMDELEKKPSGAVYRLNTDHSTKPMFGGYTVCNGPAFSLDGKILYLSNSAGREILKFGYDAETGNVEEPTVLARILETDGFPDGLTVDSEDFIWCAHWDGWRLTRFSPDGRIDAVIRLPVPRVTSCTFGGKDFNTIYVTSARTDLTKSELEKAPMSGSLFAIQSHVPGLPANKFAG